MGQDICSHRDTYGIQTHARGSHLPFGSRIWEEFPHITHKSCLLVKMKVPEELLDKRELRGAFGKHCSGIWCKEQKGKVGLCWKRLPGKSSPRVSGNEEETPPAEAMLPQSQIPASLPGSGLGMQKFSLCPLCRCRYLFVLKPSLGSFSPSHLSGALAAFPWAQLGGSCSLGLCEPGKRGTHSQPQLLSPPHLGF